MNIDPKSRGFRVLAMLLFVCALGTNGCNRAYGNKQTLRTTDCGVSWSLIKAGEVIPAEMTMCQYSITLPDYPMPGEARFKTSFKERVLAQVEVSYEYSIVDGIVFLGEAKYLGKVNSDGNDESNSTGYETAENAVIDKRIREAATTLLLKEDIVDFSQAEFEDKLLEAVNTLLESKGVKLNFLSFVPIPDEQTRLAIDILTAIKVYESRGLGEVGKQIAIARAGANKITIEVAADGAVDVK